MIYGGEMCTTAKGTQTRDDNVRCKNEETYNLEKHVRWSTTVARVKRKITEKRMKSRGQEETEGDTY